MPSWSHSIYLRCASPVPPNLGGLRVNKAGTARITKPGRRRRFGFPSFEFPKDSHCGGVDRVLVATVKFPFVATENCTVSWLAWVCRGLDVGFLSSAVKRCTLWGSRKPSLTNDTGILTVPIRAGRVSNRFNSSPPCSQHPGHLLQLWSNSSLMPAVLIVLGQRRQQH